MWEFDRKQHKAKIRFLMENSSLSSLRLREFIRDTTWCFRFTTSHYDRSALSGLFLSLLLNFYALFLNPENVITFQRPWTLNTNFRSLDISQSLSPYSFPFNSFYLSKRHQYRFKASFWYACLWNITGMFYRLKKLMDLNVLKYHTGL